MVSTIKFSQFINAAPGLTSNQFAGLSTGLNALFPSFFSWTTVTRPSPVINGFLGFNTTLEQYEFWNAAMSAWIPLQSGSGSVSLINTGTGLTGGPITTTGTISLATIPNNEILANISGGVAAPVPNTLSEIIDSAIGNTQGDILYRNATNWVVLAPGTAGNVLQTGGPAANPAWLGFTGTGNAVFQTMPTIDRPSIVGITNASAASAGDVGELISSVVLTGAAVPLVSTVSKNITSIVLSPGDWDVWGNVTFLFPAGNSTQLNGWINTVSATPPDASLSTFFVNLPLNNSGFTVPSYVINVAVPTTIYLSVQATFTVSCVSGGGLYARRRH
jgi:hypothetical protein